MEPYKIIEQFGGTDVKGYELANNWGLRFKIGKIGYDARYWANCYGVALNRWEVEQLGDHSRDNKMLIEAIETALNSNE